MSTEARKIIMFICKQLSTCKYFYKETIEGCYEAAISNYSMIRPIETKEFIVNKVIVTLNHITKHST